MKGLLVKEICMILQQKKILVMILLLSVLLDFMNDGTFAAGYLTFVGSFFIVNSISYDEYEHGFSFLFTLPVRRDTYVRSKYIFAVLGCLLFWLTGCLITLVCCLAKNQFGRMQGGMMEVCVFLPLMLIFLAVMLPVLFKFGSEKGRIVMAVICCICVLIGYLGSMITEQGGVYLESFMQMLAQLPAQPEWRWILAGAIGAVTVMILGISYLVSIAVMRRKEF